jgi:serine/threonine protein kinase, bacterial
VTPQRIGSHYLLHEQIGQGGMGSVWRAEDVESGTWRAIKVLKPEYARDPGAVMRFVRERNALVALRHPNVVALHDMIVEGERLALVMDLLTEGDLDKFRRGHGGTLPAHLAAELTAQVCDGLTAAHAAGIVHRDLKPGNVLMDGGRVRLTDFGIARIVGEASATTAGTVMGTIYYMAPEALGGAEPAPASDLYAVGITLYELLAGQPPFTGQAPVVITAHLHTAPPRPDGLPDPLWRMIAACLSKDPTARPTAAQLAAALRDPRATAGAPVTPFPARPAQPTAPAQPMSSGPVSRPVSRPVSAPVSQPWPQETGANDLGAGPHTVTGIGWLTPAGPASSAAPSGSSTWPVPPAPPAAPIAPANGKGFAKRRRTLILAAAAALVLVGAGTAVAMADGSGGAQPQAGATTTPTTIAQAGLAATGSAASAAPSGGAASASVSRSAAAAATVTVTRSTSATSRASSATSPSPSASASASTSAPAAATSPAATPTAAPSPTVSVSGNVIENLLGKWCLDVVGGSTTAGAGIEESNCVLSDTSEQWRITGSTKPNSDTYYQYQNVHSGLCLDVAGASQAVDAALVQEPCNSLSDINHSQVWRFITIGSDYEMADGHSALCMGIGDGSTAENSPVIQGDCVGATIQTWYTLASP